MAKVVTILSRVRGAGYAAQITLLSVQPPTTIPLQVKSSRSFYQDLLPVLPKYGIEIALVWARFRIATQPYGGNSLRPQLLIMLADGVCNVRPRGWGISSSRRPHPTEEWCSGAVQSCLAVRWVGSDRRSAA